MTDPNVETDPYVQKIRTARVYDVAIRSPLDEAARLSRRLANHVLFKREDLQPVFSFKLRGASNGIAALSPQEKSRGVVAASTGNHGRALAYAANLFELPLTRPRP